MADPRIQRAHHQHHPIVSPITSFIRWLQLKKYQYEVTFSLYMLTPTEKIVFNSILLTLISLLVTAAYLYLPAHMMIIYTRVWYYISGEFAATHGSGGGSVVQALKAGGSQTGMGVAGETARGEL